MAMNRENEPNWEVVSAERDPHVRTERLCQAIAELLPNAAQLDSLAYDRDFHRRVTQGLSNPSGGPKPSPKRK